MNINCLDQFVIAVQDVPVFLFEEAIARRPVCKSKYMISTILTISSDHESNQAVFRSPARYRIGSAHLALKKEFRLVLVIGYTASHQLCRQAFC